MLTSSHPAPTLPHLLRVDQVADALNIDPRTVKRLARDGYLRRVVLGRRSTRYHLTDVETLIAERTVDAKRPATNVSGRPAATEGGNPSP